jgi:photosystem II stability/assembly factor-like uncharacterized protein
MRSSVILCTLLLILFPFHATADSIWSKVGFTGGDVTDMASFPSNPDIMLACVSNHGLFRSTDRGDTWLQIMSTPISDISISEDNVAFIAGDSGVMVSKDNGETWELCLDTAAERVFAYRNGIVAARGFIIYQNYRYTYPAMQLSNDYGLTWESWEGTEDTTSLLFHPSGLVYRTGFFSVYRSALVNLNAWNLIYSSTINSYENNQDLRFGFADGDSVLYAYSSYVDNHPFPDVAGGVFKSSDAGVSWKYYTNIQSVSALEWNGDILFIGTPEGYLSTASLNSPISTVIGSFGSEITAIDTKRFGSGELLVSTIGGIFKTTDGGLNWLKSDAGIFYPEISSVQVIPMGSGIERIIVSTKESGVFYSDDSGEHWNCADINVRTIPGLLKVSATTPRRIYAAESSIYISSDNGESWQRIKWIPAAYYGWYGRSTDIEIDPRDADRITVNFYSHSTDDFRGIHYSDGRYVGDSGNDVYGWEWKVPFDSGEQFRSQFSEDGSLVWVSTNRYGADVKPLLVALNDTGEMIRSITLPGSSGYYYWLIDGQSCYVFSEQVKRFWTSPDLGETWSYTDLTLNNYVRYDDYNAAEWMGDIVLSPDKKTLFLLYPGNGVLSSGDGGLTWYQQNQGLETAVVYQLAFSPSNPSVIYAATNDGLYRRDGLTVAVDTENPASFTLRQNSPNPFNPFTTISYTLSQSGATNLSVYSITGQKVRTLVSGPLTAGTHTAIWDGRDNSGRPVSSGVYISRLQAGKMTATGRMLLLK